ncbi:hypothetical protein MMC06_001877 [Schaereria dolodes]|nr:hypothetical protein [Schaereria dolodes]
MSDAITLRSPGASSPLQSHSTPPTTAWLSGTWQVTHSTLPMWKSKRNVNIAYKELEAAAGGTKQGSDRLESTVSYQTLNSDKVKTVTGIEKASGQDGGSWDWRGKGWLVIASSHWEILGHGEQSGERWLVTYFAKTLFTPAGIDIYARPQRRTSEATVKDLKAALAALDDPSVRRLASDIFEIKQDQAITT